jgi:DNA-binding LacI/PurR family transcriptional regulator
MQSPTLTPHEVIRIAALAGVDPRTVRAVFSTDEVRRRKCHSTTRSRVERCASKLGLLPRAAEAS